MQTNRVRILTGLIGGCLLTCGSVVGEEIKGMIMSRTGDTLIVSGKSGKTTVALTSETRTKDDTGLFGLGKEDYADTVLIPGLKVKIKGESSEGRFVANTITVDGDDLETSEMIQAGLHPNAEQVAQNIQTLATHQQNISANQQNTEINRQNIAANQQSTVVNGQNIEINKTKIDQNIKDTQEVTNRFSQLSDYEVKGETTVNFKVGSFAVSDEGQEKLKQLAEAASSVSGYIIEVKGFADSTGGALMNEKLSEDRARRVIAYLVQQCNVPVFRVIAPGAMGEYQPVGSNENDQGRAANRRVEVRILVNKGIAGV